MKKELFISAMLMAVAPVYASNIETVLKERLYIAKTFYNPLEINQIKMKNHQSDFDKFLILKEKGDYLSISKLKPSINDEKLKISLLMEEHRFKEALVKIDKMLSNRPSLWGLSKKTKACLQLFKKECALNSAKKILGLNPSSAAHLLLYKVYQSHRDFDKAGKHLYFSFLKEDISTPENSLLQRQFLVSFLIDQDRLKEAEKVNREILKIYPKSPFANFTAFKVNYSLGDRPSAV